VALLAVEFAADKDRDYYEFLVRFIIKLLPKEGDRLALVCAARGLSC